MSAMNIASHRRVGSIIAVLAAVLALPLVVNLYYVQQAQTLALYIMVAAGLAVAVSYTGLISVGHAALMAAGAYAAAYLAVQLQVTFLVAALGGIVVAALVGLVHGMERQQTCC